jgi:hypothetical protein
MPAGNEPQGEPRLPGYRPGAAKAPRSRLTVPNTPQPRIDGTIIDSVTSSAAGFARGGKDVALYKAFSSVANTKHQASVNDIHDQPTVDEDTVPATRAPAGDISASSERESPAVNTLFTHQRDRTKQYTARTPAPRAPTAIVSGSSRIHKKRSGTPNRHPDARTTASRVAAVGIPNITERNPSPIFRDSKTPEPFVLDAVRAYDLAPAVAIGQPLSGEAQLADIQRQIREAETRLDDATALEIEWDEQIAARLHYGSNRWTCREGVRASRRGAAGEVGDWGHKLERVVKRIGELEDEARRIRRTASREDGFPAIEHRNTRANRRRGDDR